MSEAIYKRELNRSYMVLPCTEKNLSDHYAFRMMSGNRIGRLLPCSLRQMDGEAFLYYDISSRQPLERLYESGRLGTKELYRIFENIAAIQEDLGEYLLDEQGLLLHPDMLFADVETEELFFCYFPEKSPAENRYAGLADFILESVDHSKEHAVNIAYQFYKMSKAEYFVLSSFLPYLEKEVAAARKEEAGAEHGSRMDFEEFETDASGREYGENQRSRQNGKEEIGGGTDTGISAGISAGKSEADADEAEKKVSFIKKLFGGLFGKGRRKKKESTSSKEEWQETIWDSYAGQLDIAESGETLYFADLEQKGQKTGIPVLKEENGDRQYRLENFPVTVGKLKGKVRISLTDNSVSRLHARFETEGTGICVRDLNSRNGTLVNGVKLAPNEDISLEDGDRLQFGRERFVLEWK